jgi:hypothetical protein
MYDSVGKFGIDQLDQATDEEKRRMKSELLLYDAALLTSRFMPILR